LIADLRGKEARLTEQENRLLILTQEIERLNILLRAKLEENESLKSKCQKFEIALREAD
jgi:hypothetical protein